MIIYCCYKVTNRVDNSLRNKSFKDLKYCALDAQQGDAEISEEGQGDNL